MVRDPARLQCSNEGCRVDDGAPCGVDQVRRRLHQSDLALADQVEGLLHQGGMDRDDVRLGQQFVERHYGHPIRIGRLPLNEGVEGDDLQAEGLRPERHFARSFTKGDQAEGHLIQGGHR